MTITKEAAPRSVVNLHIQAQISHLPRGDAKGLMKALQQPRSDEERRTAAHALQEAEIPGMADLLVDKVMTGRAMHDLLRSLHTAGLMRRPDLLEWSERFA